MSGFEASSRWAYGTGPAPQAHFLSLLEAAAAGQGKELLALDNIGGALDDAVEEYLAAAMRPYFPESEWIVLKSDADNAMIFRQHTGRGLHIDASTTASYIHLCTAPAVKSTLAHLDQALLDWAVQPVNLWMLLDGARGLLLAPSLGRGVMQAALDEAEHALCDAIRSDEEGGLPEEAGVIFLGRRHPEHRPTQEDEPHGMPILLFDGSRVHHCGLRERELEAAIRRADRAEQGGHVQDGGTSGDDTDEADQAESRLWRRIACGLSVDFRKLAIRRAATTWGGGSIDLSPVARSILYGRAPTDEDSHSNSSACAGSKDEARASHCPVPVAVTAAPSDIEQPPAPAPAALPLAARSAPVVSAEVHAGPVTKAEESALRALEAKFGGLADKDRFAVVLHCPSSNFHCLSLTCPLPFHCPSMTCPLSYPAGSQCPGGG